MQSYRLIPRFRVREVDPSGRAWGGHALVTVPCSGPDDAPMLVMAWAAHDAWAARGFRVAVEYVPPGTMGGRGTDPTLQGGSVGFRINRDGSPAPFRNPD